jgi:serine-type D-Ala-D-Ala carboxypeptidase/endopeptidase
LRQRRKLLSLRRLLPLQVSGWERCRADAAGGLTCAVDSIDQHAFGIPCSNVLVNGALVSFEVPTFGGKWTGAISSDGKTLTGT